MDGYGGWGRSARDRAAAAASGWVVAVEPANEPLTVAEAKLHLRQTSADRDADVAAKSTAVRQDAEDRTGRAIVTQTRRLTLETLPRAWGGVGAYPGWREATRVRLPGPPLQAPTAAAVVITYVAAADGGVQTLDPSLYRINADREPAVVEPLFGRFWPVSRIQTGAIRITYKCGWPATTVAAAIAAGTRTVTPADMTGINPGVALTVTSAGSDPAALADLERVLVTAVTGTTFTATFAKSHAGGAAVNGVPEKLKQAMLMLLDHSVRFTGGDDEKGQTSALGMPQRAADILESFWVGESVGGA